MPVYREDDKGLRYVHHIERIQSKFNKTLAYFSLETTFIALPEHVLSGFINMLNNEENAECEILKNLGGILHCKKLLFPQHFYDLKVEFQFENTFGKQNVSLFPSSLIKECIHHNEGEHVYECFFNLHVSRDNRTVLGEAFIKNFYTIFDSSSNQIKLTQPVNIDYFKVPVMKPKKYGFFIYAAFFLIIILTILLSPFYMFKAYSWIKNKFQEKGHQQVFSEVKGVRENSLFATEIK